MERPVRSAVVAKTNCVEPKKQGQLAHLIRELPYLHERMLPLADLTPSVPTNQLFGLPRLLKKLGESRQRGGRIPILVLPLTIR